MLFLFGASMNRVCSSLSFERQKHSAIFMSDPAVCPQGHFRYAPGWCVKVAPLPACLLDVCLVLRGAVRVASLCSAFCVCVFTLHQRAPELGPHGIFAGHCLLFVLERCLHRPERREHQRETSGLRPAPAVPCCLLCTTPGPVLAPICKAAGAVEKFCCGGLCPASRPSAKTG